MSYNKRVQHKPHRKNFSLKEQLDWVMLNLHAGGFWNKWMLEMYNNKVRVSCVGILTHCHCADIICVDVSGRSTTASRGSEHVSLWLCICSSRDRCDPWLCAVGDGNSI